MEDSHGWNLNFSNAEYGPGYTLYEISTGENEIFVYMLLPFLMHREASWRDVMTEIVTTRCPCYHAK